MALDLKTIKERLARLKDPKYKEPKRTGIDKILYTDDWDEADENIYFISHGEHSQKFVERLMLTQHL